MDDKRDSRVHGRTTRYIQKGKRRRINQNIKDKCREVKEAGLNGKYKEIEQCKPSELASKIQENLSLLVGNHASNLVGLNQKK